MLWGVEFMVEITASLKSLRSAWAVHSSSMACSSAPVLPARSPAIIRSLRGWRLGFVEPRI